MRLTLAMTCGAAALGLALGGCDENKIAVGAPLASGATATATLVTAAGASVGRATATEVTGGLRYTLDVNDMPPGTHGAHIHLIGRCDAPGFTTAGAHWNPTTMRHGTMNAQGPHAGDLPNLIVGNDGRGTLGITIPGSTMAGLLDADGAAVIVHADADDLKTDPSGNSGGRIACGVLSAS
jgi:Cu-Zn family superoxide dismutase